MNFFSNEHKQKLTDSINCMSYHEKSLLQKHISENTSFFKVAITVDVFSNEFSKILDYSLEIGKKFESFLKHLAINFLNSSRKESNFTFCSYKTKELLLVLVSLYQHLTNIDPLNLRERDWLNISNLIGLSQDPYFLKFEWFCSLKPSITRGRWTQYQKNCFSHLMFQQYPKLFDLKNAEIVLPDWEIITYNYNKYCENPSDFKSKKKIKELWANHINPRLKTKNWSFEEDITLLEKSLIHPKQWCILMSFLKGKNQHMVKNRFFSLIFQILEIKKKILICMKIKDLKKIIRKTKEILKEEKTKETNIYNKKQKLSEEKQKNIFNKLKGFEGEIPYEFQKKLFKME